MTPERLEEIRKTSQLFTVQPTRGDIAELFKLIDSQQERIESQKQLLSEAGSRLYRNHDIAHIQSFDWGSVCGVCNEPDNIFDRIQEALK